MTRSLADALGAMLAAGEAAVVVRVAEALGSTPREANAAMIITPQDVLGTIGGGRLEWEAIARARTMLRDNLLADGMDIPLGPAVGQCCGGRVLLDLRRADTAVLAALQAAEEDDRTRWPTVFVFGAGHVGRALAAALDPLPLRLTVIESRTAYLGDLPARASPVVSADPAAEVRAAPAHAVFVVTTHSHQLDYAITEAALARGDAAYVGMIGSATKRARFARWFTSRGGTAAQLSALVCPIGRQGVRDKRPAVIAAFAAAEVLASALRAVQTTNEGGERDGRHGQAAGRDRPAA
jgi:xanthine dehydrogenase accessory protein XdhC